MADHYSGNGGKCMVKKETIAICVTSLHQKAVHSVIAELGQEAAKRGYRIRIFAPFSDLYHQSEGDKAQQQIFDIIPYDRICAMILFSETIKNEHQRQKLAERAREHQVPVFSLKQSVEGCCNFRYDSENALADIIRHLIEVHHCRRINMISGLQGNEVAERRVEVYRSVLEEYDYPIEEERIGYGDFWAEPAKNAAAEFLDSGLPEPEAIVCANDAMAIGVCDFLAERGIRVPEDMIVTGLGGIQEREFHFPLLTTAIYDPVLSAKCIIDIIEEVLENGARMESSVTIPCKKIYTESCGCRQEDVQNPQQHLMITYGQLERERQYSHAMHSLIDDVNENGTVAALAEHLPRYLDGPRISLYHFYLDARFAARCKLGDGRIDERRFVLLNQEEGTAHKLLPYSAYREQEEQLYGESRQILSMPLYVDDKVYGIFSINYESKRTNHECLYELIMTLNNLLSSIHNRARFLRVSHELNEVSEQTIQSLAEIVEAKSEFTGLHVKRVSEYTRILAEAMGYSAKQVDMIRIASMLHDIGKINIPPAILEKPGKLTEEEFEIIKGHVTDGGNMLRNAPGEIMQTAYKIALQHHEKWDGSGYLGMKGEEIAMESRIVAIADVFDALVSKRPYKEPFQDQKAYEIIVQDSGTHFDPQVVVAFQKNFDRFLEVHASYQDEKAVG